MCLGPLWVLIWSDRSAIKIVYNNIELAYWKKTNMTKGDSKVMTKAVNAGSEMENVLLDSVKTEVAYAVRRGPNLICKLVCVCVCVCVCVWFPMPNYELIKLFRVHR